MNLPSAVIRMPSGPVKIKERWFIELTLVWILSKRIRKSGVGMAGHGGRPRTCDLMGTVWIGFAVLKRHTFHLKGGSVSTALARQAWESKYASPEKLEMVACICNPQSFMQRWEAEPRNSPEVYRPDNMEDTIANYKRSILSPIRWEAWTDI
jgi:hypothetical protein